jgi:hypothetical protein
VSGAVLIYPFAEGRRAADSRSQCLSELVRVGVIATGLLVRRRRILPLVVRACRYRAGRGPTTG